TLRGVVEQTRTRPLEVLVVHDFDEDTTVPVVKRLQADMPELRLHRNTLGRGVLNAMKSGLRAARAPYVVITMGDGSDDAADIDPMYGLARAGADVVAGSRYMRGGRQLGGPLVKRTMSRAAGLSLHWLGGLPIHDATSNFRLYSKRLLNQVTIESPGGFELGLDVPPHRALEAFGERDLRLPAELGDARDVERVAVVVARPVGDELDQAARLAHDVEHGLGHLQSRRLRARADVVDGADRGVEQ